MLSNAYFLAKFRFDIAENKPTKTLQNFAKKIQNLFAKFCSRIGDARGLSRGRFELLQLAGPRGGEEVNHLRVNFGVLQDQKESTIILLEKLQPA